MTGVAKVHLFSHVICFQKKELAWAGVCSPSARKLPSRAPHEHFPTTPYTGGVRLTQPRPVIGAVRVLAPHFGQADVNAFGVRRGFLRVFISVLGGFGDPSPRAGGGSQEARGYGNGRGQNGRQALRPGRAGW